MSNFATLEPRELGRETKKWPSDSHALRDHQNNGQPNARTTVYSESQVIIFARAYFATMMILVELRWRTVPLKWCIYPMSPQYRQPIWWLLQGCLWVVLTQPALIINSNLDADACFPLSFGDEDRDTEVATFPDSQVGSGLDSRQYRMEHGHGQSTIYKKFSCDRCEGIGLSVATSIMNHGCLHGIHDHVNVWFLPVCFACTIYIRLLSSWFRPNESSCMQWSNNKIW